MGPLKRVGYINDSLFYAHLYTWHIC